MGVNLMVILYSIGTFIGGLIIGYFFRGIKDEKRD